jgi:predicted amidohydrolase
VRFAGLFQCLADKGAQIIVLPSAFTCPTGEAHWHSLIRARAIENQVYMVASGQGGVHPNQRSTYGHSLIADPWGEIIAEHSQHSGQASGQGIGLVSGLFDPNVVASICANMPLKQHNRFKYELIDESICRE